MRNLELEKANQFLASENREKEKNTAELLRVNEQLRAFNQVSNHDLQEPLRKLQMFASRILETENDNLSAKGKELFKRMSAASDRMSQLISDLLAFSENNYYSQKFEQVQISQLVAEAKMEMQDLISDKKAIVEVIESGKFNLIYLQFKQLLVNMIANSLKFSKPEIPSHIVIICQMEKGDMIGHPGVAAEKYYCHITFSDNGIGFDPKYKNSIFELFKSFHNGNHKGTGIGLAIVRKIVENHHGFINASSEINNGAMFHIYIPQ